MIRLMAAGNGLIDSGQTSRAARKRLSDDGQPAAGAWADRAPRLLNLSAAVRTIRQGLAELGGSRLTGTSPVAQAIAASGSLQRNRSTALQPTDA